MANEMKGIKMESNMSDSVMADMIKLERIAKIEARISANDEHTIKSIKSWIKDDKKPGEKKK